MGTGIVKYLRRCIECVLEVIYPVPENCIVCDEPIEDALICKRCSSKIQQCGQKFCLKKDGLEIFYYSVAYYSGTMMELIIRLKYKNDFQSGQVIASYMTETIRNHGLVFDFITYVPASRDSLKKRGYNQMEYIAKNIRKNLNVKVLNCLKKTRKTKDQIGLDGEKRWENLIDSFAVIDRKAVENKNIILIDDVITSGATSFYCAKELIKNGAKSIIVLTAAKSRI